MTGELRHRLSRPALLGVIGLWAAACLSSEVKAAPGSNSSLHGSGTIRINPEFLDSVGWDIAVRGGFDPLSRGPVASTPGSEGTTFSTLVASPRTLRALRHDPEASEVRLAVLYGALEIMTEQTTFVVANLSIEIMPGGRWVAMSHASEPEDSFIAFVILDASLNLSAHGRGVSFVGELVVSEALAAKLNAPEIAGMSFGWVTLDSNIAVSSPDEKVAGFDDAGAQPADSELGTAAVAGPDVIVGAIYELQRWGKVDNITAFSIGTASCNIGTQPAEWIRSTNRHPVIAQNMYRLKNGRFEQIGQSWLKHGFLALSETLCSGLGNCMGDIDGDHLGVGCSDPYDAMLNGGSSPGNPNLGPRHEVNPTTGFFLFPIPRNSCNIVCKRLQVHDADLEPDLNLGAQYFVEAHYIVPDDAEAGNNNNNASYRRIVVTEQGSGNYVITFTGTSGGTTQREKPGIQAWRDNDAQVRVVPIDVPGDRRFFLGFKVSGLGQGRWRYEYAVQNLNSDRAAGSFAVPLPAFAKLANIGFHDVDHHSGSPMSNADWTVSETTELGVRYLLWNTENFKDNANANALRWGTLYNFRFEADAPPIPGGEITLGMFKPGEPASMNATSTVPGGPVAVISSDPPNGAIDARQPSQLDGTPIAGWSQLRIDLNILLIGTGQSDFTLTQIGGVGDPPEIIGYVPVTDTAFNMFLSAGIGVAARTRIAHRWSDAMVEISNLPGDVDADGTSDAQDVEALIAALNQEGPSLPVWSFDIDRSTLLNPLDLMRLLDLNNGADAFEPFNGKSLQGP